MNMLSVDPEGDSGLSHGGHHSERAAQLSILRLEAGVFRLQLR